MCILSVLITFLLATNISSPQQKVEVGGRARLIKPRLCEEAPTAWHRRWRKVLKHETASCSPIPTAIMA